MEPLNFGGNNAVFGMYHPSKKGHSSGAVLISPPLFIDFYRTHQIIKDTAIHLSELGYDVLRFDFRGTGDSALRDDEVTLEHWLDDLKNAWRELEDLSGSKISIIGIRLSAALSLMAFADQERKLSAITLWDPIIHGKNYIDELNQVQQEYFEDYASSRPDRTTLLSDELVGFRCRPGLIESIRSIDVASVIEPSYSNIPITHLHSSQNRKTSTVGKLFNRTLEIKADCNWETMSGSMIFDKQIIEQLVQSIVEK